MNVATTTPTLTADATMTIRLGLWDHRSATQPIKLYVTPTTRLTSPVTLSCCFAETFGNWTADVGAESMTHMGGYNCRKIAGSIFMSQHSYGNAIEISIVDGVSIANN